jgi:hypothetical protein
MLSSTDPPVGTPLIPYLRSSDPGDLYNVSCYGPQTTALDQISTFCKVQFSIYLSLGNQTTLVTHLFIFNDDDVCAILSLSNIFHKVKKR